MAVLVYTNYPVDWLVNSGTMVLGEHTIATFVGINELLAITLVKM